MSMTIAATRARGADAVRSTKAAWNREEAVRRRVGLAWGLLVLNVMGYIGLIVHVPSVAGKVLTQGALPAALLVLLTVNRRIVVRPNVFLCLVTLLPLEAIFTALDPQFFGTVYRTFRLAEFVFALWLLSPWWGRRDLLLLRYHMIALSVILASVLLGIFVAPGHAFLQGRLNGAIWIIPGTQVAHYSAVLAGLVAILWFCRRLSGRIALPVVCVALILLVLTHTRTALVGFGAALVVAGLSLIRGNERVRRVFAIGIVALSVVVVTASGLLATWLARGESTKGLTELTGRTKVWGPVLAFPRDKFHEIFGFGLSNSSFNGLPIDSNWVSSYQEQGLFGIAVCVAILLFLFTVAYFRPMGLRRALALFLVTYCLVASFTEDGFTDATPYMLELALAASLLMPPIRARVMSFIMPVRPDGALTPVVPEE
jgi:hypothetical protein